MAQEDRGGGWVTKERFNGFVLHEVYLDDQGVWEPLGWARTHRWSRTEEDAQELTTEALTELHAEGAIFFYRLPWDKSHDLPEDPWPLTKAEVEGELAATWWRTESVEPADVWIRITPLGQQRVEAEMREEPDTQDKPA